MFRISMFPYFHYSAYTTWGVCIIDRTLVKLSISYFSASFVIYLLELFHGSLPINTVYSFISFVYSFVRHIKVENAKVKNVKVENAKIENIN